jgi:hypothetical protein
MRSPLRLGGYARWSDPELPSIEADTHTCHHCQRVMFGKSSSPILVAGPAYNFENAGFCRRCMKFICGPCADLGTCKPWEKQCEEMERRITTQVERDRAIRRML